MVRDGQDLISVVPVDATTAMIGDRGRSRDARRRGGDRTRRPAPSPVPRSRLRSKGLPQLGNSRRRGDHRFVFNVVIPGNLNEEQKRLAGELDGSLTDENRAPKESGTLLAHAQGIRLIRLAVRCSPDQADLVLAELTVLAPGGVEESGR